MDISKAVQIEGWMTPPELFWLAYHAAKRKVIVEVGSYLGRSTRALADHCAGTVYAIDDWYGPRDVELTAEQREKIFDKFVANMKDTKATLRVLRMDLATLDKWNRQTPDMVFIDGAHDYDSVKRDVSFWLRHIAPGGLMCGHDGNYLSVAKAVYELLPSALISPSTSIWFAEVPR